MEHFKADGSLDMRFSSSKAAVASGSYGGSSGGCYGGSYGSSGGGGGSHFKKDGTLDMRYTSKQAVAAGYSGSGSSDLHCKKDGTLDKRYNSSKFASAMKGLAVSDGLNYKKDGTLDMRFKSSKEAVTKGIGCKSNAREEYWSELMRDACFARQWQMQCQEPVSMPYSNDFGQDIIRDIRTEFKQMSSDVSSAIVLPTDIPKLNYSALHFIGKELGKGAFGVVKKAKWKRIIVAVKKLHLKCHQLTKKERSSFMREVCILHHLGKHENLVQFHGYCLSTLCIVMEFVELGSLSYLLHYCEDKKIEVKMADGRIKKRIIVGIVDGMRQLHDVEAVHGDIKPQNFLVTNDFTAKITDFGLSNLRGKTSISIQSSKITTDLIIGGTGGYMAPELLDSASPPDYTSDVYSFGILLNEVVAEEEPYHDQLKNLAGRGHFAAFNYAKLGYRPKIRSDTPPLLADLINDCWNAEPTNRPRFDNIRATIRSENLIIPNSPK